MCDLNVSNDVKTLWPNMPLCPDCGGRLKLFYSREDSLICSDCGDLFYYSEVEYKDNELPF